MCCNGCQSHSISYSDNDLCTATHYMYLGTAMQTAALMCAQNPARFRRANMQPRRVLMQRVLGEWYQGCLLLPPNHDCSSRLVLANIFRNHKTAVYD
jgi:hypothetical protein